MSLKRKPLKKCHTDSRQMIDDIHRGIVKDLDEDELVEYYMDNGLLLNDYYSDKKEVKQDTNHGILRFFNRPQSPTEDTEERIKKHDLFNQYLSNT